MNKINIKKSRFRDASWFELVNNITIPIVIGGAGGIGSWLTLFLSRMLTSSILLYDFDKVEEINLAGQLYGVSHINKNKADAMKTITLEFAGYNKVFPQSEKYTDSSLYGPIMFSAFDNMEARKTMFNNWKKGMTNGNKDNVVFIDGRLLAEQFQVFCVTDKTADLYNKKHLFNDSEVESTNCSYKQTTHFAASIASKMVHIFTQWLVRNEEHVMPVPFKYEEIGNLFLTTIEYGTDI